MNQIDLTNLVVYAGAILPVVQAIVEALKQMLNFPSRMSPAASLVVGIVAGLCIEYGAMPTPHMWFRGLATGVIAGLGASGLYSGTKASLESRYDMTPKPQPPKASRSRIITPGDPKPTGATPAKP